MSEWVVCLFDISIAFSQTLERTFVNKIYVISDGIFALGHGCAVFGIISCAVTAYFLYQYRQEKIIRGARISFLWVVLVGCVLFSISISLFVELPGNVNCAGYMWVLYYSLSLMLVPICGKTWAIYTIFALATNLKEFKWTNKKLAAYFIGIPLFSVTVLLIVWSAAQSFDPVYVVDTTNGELIPECPFSFDSDNPHSVYVILSIISVFMLFFFVCYVSWQSRSVPANFRESLWLGACIFTVTLVSIFFLPMLIINEESSQIVSIRKVAGIISAFIVLECILFFLFWIKFLIIWVPDVQERLGINLQTNRSHSKSNKSSAKEMSRMEHDTALREMETSRIVGTGSTLSPLSQPIPATHLSAKHERVDTGSPISPTTSDTGYRLGLKPNLSNSKNSNSLNKKGLLSPKSFIEAKIKAFHDHEVASNSVTKEGESKTYTNTLTAAGGFSSDSNVTTDMSPRSNDGNSTPNSGNYETKTKSNNLAPKGRPSVEHVTIKSDSDVPVDQLLDKNGNLQMHARAAIGLASTSTVSEYTTDTEVGATEQDDVVDGLKTISDTQSQQKQQDKDGRTSVVL